MTNKVDLLELKLLLEKNRCGSYVFSKKFNT
jgi:hypothetical protein